MNNKEKIQNAFNCFYNYNEDTQKIRNEFFENQEFYLKLLKTTLQAINEIEEKLCITVSEQYKDFLKAEIGNYIYNPDSSDEFRAYDAKELFSFNYIGKNIGYNAENARKETILNNVKNSMQNSSKWLEEDYDRAISLLKTIQSYKNAENLITLLSNQKRELHEKIEIAKKENILSSVVNSLAKSDKWEDEEFDHAIEALNGIRDFKNAEEIIAICEEKKLQAEADAVEKAEKKKKRAKRIKMISVLSVISTRQVLTSLYVIFAYAIISFLIVWLTS